GDPGWLVRLRRPVAQGARRRARLRAERSRRVHRARGGGHGSRCAARGVCRRLRREARARVRQAARVRGELLETVTQGDAWDGAAAHRPTPRGFEALRLARWLLQHGPMRTTAILAAFLALFSLVPATAHATDVEVVRHENIIGGKVFGLLGLPSARETGEIGAAIDVRLERGGGFSEFGVGATFSMPKALDGAAWVEGGYSIYLNNPDDVGV